MWSRTFWKTESVFQRLDVLQRSVWVRGPVTQLMTQNSSNYSDLVEIKYVFFFIYRTCWKTWRINNGCHQLATDVLYDGASEIQSVFISSFRQLHAFSLSKQSEECSLKSGKRVRKAVEISHAVGWLMLIVDIVFNHKKVVFIITLNDHDSVRVCLQIVWKRAF